MGAKTQQNKWMVGGLFLLLIGAIVFGVWATTPPAFPIWITVQGTHPVGGADPLSVTVVGKAEGGLVFEVADADGSLWIDRPVNQHSADWFVCVENAKSVWFFEGEKLMLWHRHLGDTKTRNGVFDVDDLDVLVDDHHPVPEAVKQRLLTLQVARYVTLETEDDSAKTAKGQ